MTTLADEAKRGWAATCRPASSALNGKNPKGRAERQSGNVFVFKTDRLWRGHDISFGVDL